jgi:hypothetical protein
VWAGLLGPYLTQWQNLGLSECVVKGPTAKCLKGRAVTGLYFTADWCHTCSEFTPVLERLYTVQKAQSADQLEVVLVSWCREAKATKYYNLTMPWLSMWHDANKKVGMKVPMTALMEKFGVSTISALVLLDKRGCIICPEARGWVNADPKGKAFPWREMAEVPIPCPEARAVVNFDLPLAKLPSQPVSPEKNPTAKPSNQRCFFCNESNNYTKF